MTEVEKPVRKDVARNRALLLRSAEELFAERGVDVTLDEIARHAGVGVATAYRHFANKQVLVEAMFESRMSQFLAVMHESELIDDPREAFEAMLYRICELQAADRGMREAIRANQAIDKVGQYHERGEPLFDGLFYRAKQAGAYRADCEPSDMIVAFWMIAAVIEATSEQSPDLWRRTLSFFLDGLRAEGEPRHPAPAGPLTRGQVGSIMDSLG